MRKAVPAAAAFVVVVGVAAAAALGWWNATPRDAATAARLSVKTTLAPNPSFFGDPVVAEVDVLLDRGAVAGGSVRVEPVFAPFVVRGQPTFAREQVGRLERLRYRYTLGCLTEDCLPLRGSRTVRFSPVRVTASSGGPSRAATAPWPSARIATRLRDADVAARQPPFRSSTALPPPVNRVDPGMLAGWLTAVAALLTVCGLALLALEAHRLARRTRRRLVTLTPLEAALKFARESAIRPDPADRRKALGLLALTLGEETIASAAWSEHAPSPERTLAIATDVEEERG